MISWIWTRESQSQIQDVKNKYNSDMASITRDLELKYRETLTENRRTAAHLEVELEKERQRVQGYKKALISQSQQLMEERKQLQQERQEHRLEMEKNLLLKVAKDPVGAELNLEEDLRDIFKNDRHCADLLNMDKRKNGNLMWLYLRYWQLQVTLQRHKRAEETLKGASPNSSRP
ncbi:coiled-coil domain-containing protein 127-like [Sinocyclocheilus anshuiensis]|uniref:coiled-coil domain-containing protein 127-like n=1 Tax=Sinocyclocheilus anshuiensis TaxID=1608454 RepID=UPI0007B86382|nr:PREDICTED: coiled-coil domain-containing protein 127-like [Sinocyclocheilus anshuiensis]